MHYRPSPTVLRFMASRAFVKVLCGPVGGGKSTGTLMALWTMATQQEPFHNIRRTKFCVLRNTMAQLKSTVKPLIDQWFVDLPTAEGASPLGVWRVTENTFEVRAKLRDGTIVHTEFVLMAADTPDDVRRLLSVEFSAAWVEEAREVDSEVFSGLQGRVARFPNRASGGVTYPCVICSTNPPPVGTFWHELMTSPPSNVEVFMQPAALLEDGSINPEAENLEHLDPAYYDNLVQGKTSDWIAVYLRNKFGAGGMGQPVFKGTFRSEFHVAKSPLRAVSASMKKIVVGSDNGLTAAAVIGQEDARGRVNCLGEAYVPQGESMGYERFLDTLLVPRLRALNAAPHNVIFMVDPACFQRSQANEVTIAQVIQRRGYQVVAAPTNIPARRISAAEGLLMRQIDGGPALAVDASLSHLINTLDWGYRHRKTANDQGIATPEKNFFSHMGDAFQYFCLYFNAAAAVGGYGKPTARTVTRKDYAYT